MNRPVALIPGSFDPPTRAHVHIWRSLGTLFDAVIAIGRNSEKPTSLFRADARKTLIERILETERINARVIVYDDLVSECAKREQADIVIRGVRGVEDLTTETAMQDFLDRRHGPPTLYMPAPAHLRTCSSTFVRGLLPFDGADDDVRELLPDAVYRVVRHGAPKMRQAFRSLWKKIGAVTDPDPVFEDLLLRYSEPPREYHTMKHIEMGLRRMDELLAQDPTLASIDWNAVKFAYWFHDAIMTYTLNNTDEECSAELARTVALEATQSSAFADRVRDLVNATTHKTLDLDRESRVLVDADLSILGTSETVFDEYEARIRMEYAFVPAKIRHSLRATVLSKFVSPIRETVYLTRAGRELWEVRAQANLARSLSRLGARQDPPTIADS